MDLAYRPKMSLISLIVSITYLQPCSGFCPKGFGGDGFFPTEWEIPAWPAMDSSQAGPLRTVAMQGFKMEILNEEYLEGPTEDFIIQGRESYWAESGEYFLYYCQRFTKWRIAQISGFGQIKTGNCLAFASDTHPGRDIRNDTALRDWIEVVDGAWKRQEEAGVDRLGTLQEQIDAAAQEQSDEECSEEGEDGVLGGKKKSNCPVMPVVREGVKKGKEAAKAFGKWVRRLVPALLAAPSEEEEEVSDEALGEEARKPTKWEKNKGSTQQEL